MPCLEQACTPYVIVESIFTRSPGVIPPFKLRTEFRPAYKLWLSVCSESSSHHHHHHHSRQQSSAPRLSRTKDSFISQRNTSVNEDHEAQLILADPATGGADLASRTSPPPSEIPTRKVLRVTLLASRRRKLLDKPSCVVALFFSVWRLAFGFAQPVFCRLCRQKARTKAVRRWLYP